MDRRSFIWKTAQSTVILGVAPFVGRLVDSTVELTPIEMFVKGLKEHGEDYLVFDPDENDLLTGKIVMVDLGLLEETPVLRTRFEFVGPDRVMFCRNSDTYKIDVIGKSNIDGIRMDDGMIALKKIKLDIMDYYLPERRDNDYDVPEGAPLYPSTWDDKLKRTVL